MQTNPISNPSPTRPYNLIQLPSSANSPQLPQEISPEEASKQRWKILFLICSTTFGTYFIQSLLNYAHDERKEAFNMSARDYSQYLNWAKGYLYLIPIITGFMINRFGINKTFRYLVLAVVLGNLLVASSFKIHNFDMYLYGDPIVRGSALGLWVAQIYMTIKWFKGKELSFAIGLLGFSRGFIFYIETMLNPYIESIGLLKLLSFGVILCVFAGVAAIFMSKIDMTVRQEEEVLVEEVKLKKPVVTALVIAIICIKLAEKVKWNYLSFLLSSDSQAFFKILTKVESLAYYAPIVFFPLFGFFADRKGGRITGVFSSFLLLFLGNLLFSRAIESVESNLTLTILAACLLFQVGNILFEVSIWGIVGHFASKRTLGVVLGVAYSLSENGPQLLILFMGQPEKGGVFALAFALVVGIVSMFYAWVSLKKKEDFTDRGENQPQVIMPATEVN